MGSTRNQSSVAASVARLLRYVAPTVVFAALIGACSTASYNLPAITSTSGSERLPGKFIWRDLISDAPEASAAFYSALFEWEFRPLPLSGAEYWLIRHRGKPIGGMVRQQGIPAQRDISQWVSAIAVDDAAAATAAVRGAGGTVLREPVSLGERGTIAVYADTGGAIFAVLQTVAGDPADTGELPAPGGFLWHELWAAGVDTASNFYASFTGLSVEARDTANLEGQAIAYRVLRDDRVPRAGIRSLPRDDMPTLWMPYLRLQDRQELDDTLARVPDLGGTVLVPALPRPAGGFVAVIAGPSGAPIALQTWGDAQPMLEEI